MKAIKYERGWIDRVEPGQPFRMIKGDNVADQVSRKRLREHGELLTVQVVADKLKVKPQTVYEWVHKGDARGRKLGHFQVGRHVRISETHLEEFLAA